MNQILFENEDLLAVNKPAGISSAPLTEEDRGRPNALDLLQESHSLSQGGLLHRLDHDTSGVLLFGKNKKTYELFRKEWSERVQKFYRARISDELSTDWPIPHTIDWPIGNSKKSSKKVIAVRPEDSVTHRRLEKIIRGKLRQAKTIILKKEEQDLHLQLITGVRHQIRVHLSTAGCPILGDALYGGKKAAQLYLHAEKVIVQTEKEKLEIEAPLPDYWT